MASQELSSQTFEKLFPDPKRRGLATAFVEKVSQIPTVDKIGVLELSAGQNKIRRIFVFTDGLDGIPDVDDMMGVYKIVQEICTNEDDYKLLGFTPVTTESEFAADKLDYPKIRNVKPVIIYQRQPQ